MDNAIAEHGIIPPLYLTQRVKRESIFLVALLLLSLLLRLLLLLARIQDKLIQHVPTNLVKWLETDDADDK